MSSTTNFDNHLSVQNRISRLAHKFFIGLGLVLLVMLGSRAMSQVTDSSFTRGKPRTAPAVAVHHSVFGAPLPGYTAFAPASLVTQTQPTPKASTSSNDKQPKSDDKTDGKPVTIEAKQLLGGQVKLDKAKHTPTN